MRSSLLLGVVVLSACDRDGRAALPACDEVLPGGAISETWALGSGERPMVVVRSDREELRLAEDPDCDPSDEAVLFVETSSLPEEAWLPPVGAELVVTHWPGEYDGYAEIRTHGGTLLWAGGEVHPEEGDRRFWWVEVPGGPACEDVCIGRRPAAAALETDDGDVALSPGDRRTVTIDGEPFVALLDAAAQYGHFGPLGPCGLIIEEWRPSFAAVALVRTTPAEVTLAEPREPPEDDCPADLPTDGAPCTTRPELLCNYEYGGGCTESLECRACYWERRLRGEPFGVDCDFDSGG